MLFVPLNAFGSFRTYSALSVINPFHCGEIAESTGPPCCPRPLSSVQTLPFNLTTTAGFLEGSSSWTNASYQMCGGWRRVSIEAEATAGYLSCRRGAHREMNDGRMLRRTKRFLSSMFYVCYFI